MIEVKVTLISGKKYGDVDESGCFIYRSPRRRIFQEATQHRPRISVNGVKYLVSRYVYEYIHGPLPAGYVARHTCDNERCTELNHLIGGTHSQNAKDTFDRGRQPNRGPMWKTRRRLERLNGLSL